MSKIIISYMNRLGNQMFQYALHRAFELRGYDVKASIKRFTDNGTTSLFKLPSVFKNIKLDFYEEDKDEKYDVYIENFLNASVYDQYLLQSKHDNPLMCTGYFQTEKYFSDIRDDLLEKFKFNINDTQLKKDADSILNSVKPTVSIHIRRTDYVYLTNYNICDKKYYDDSIEYIKNKLNTDDIKFIIFSDDIGWCKDNFPDFHFINRNNYRVYEDWYDMYLMSCCNHNIISNSSFGWWGAWLNTNIDKIVIAPDRWLKDCPTPDIWCDDWVKIYVNI